MKRYRISNKQSTYLYTLNLPAVNRPDYKAPTPILPIKKTEKQQDVVIIR